VIGNACGLLELAGQLGGGTPDAGAVVFVTVATGTTFAGFLLGAHALAAAGGPRLRIIGAAVDGAPVVPFTLGLIRWAERRLRLPALVPARHIEILPADRGIPFARVTPAAEDACRRVERAFGLRLDPIFGGKTWCAMERCLEARPELRDHPVVYWHCGHTPEWRALCSALRPGRSVA
jgi:1-aminocyclopropane-1-carboxylate deaminase/D-cysteine desulfhydrase-like pyridoxal-dependent ACC family enzyme